MEEFGENKHSLKADLLGISRTFSKTKRRVKKLLLAPQSAGLHCGANQK